MIRIGLTGFGDHEELYGKLKAGERLREYSRHFDVVEIDSSFYAVPSVKNTAKWTADTPEGFKFVVKAYQGMTGHLRGKKNYFDDEETMYKAFHEAIAPMREAGKLAAALFQYPPWFDCTRENVDLLRRTKAYMGDVPCTLELRNRSWYAPEFKDKTIAFMKKEGWIHTIVDEPQAGTGSIPIVPVATTSDMTYVRLHGRNEGGWHASGRPDWRKLRYLYHYDAEELAEWRDRLLALERETDTVYVVFNNNSAGDATPNAKALMDMLAGMSPDAAAARADEQYPVPAI